MRQTAILLALMLLMGSMAPSRALADYPEDTKVAAAGILTDGKPDFAMIWMDGDDAPSKFVYVDGFDKTVFGLPPKGKGLVGNCRVQFTYTKGDDGNKLLTIKREPPVARGTMTGTVLFSNNFWVVIKPKSGPPDGFAINFPPGDMGARLTALQKGDTVTIKFHSDSERHRIDALQVAAPKPEAPAKPADNAADPSAKPDAPATQAAAAAVTPVPAASQPAQSPDEQAAAKLKLAQLYIDNKLNDRAKGMLQDIIKQYPGTESAATAEARLAELGG